MVIKNIRKQMTDYLWLVWGIFPKQFRRLFCLSGKPFVSAVIKAFKPGEARRIANKLEFHDTPKHGSWLDMAEIELSVLSRQCLSRRIPDQDTLRNEVKAWEDERNACKSAMKWRFTTEDA